MKKEKTAKSAKEKSQRTQREPESVVFTNEFKIIVLVLAPFAFLLCALCGYVFPLEASL